MIIRHYIIVAKTKTALHVGSQQRANDVSDSMFRRNSNGDIILPGTGIAGAIRSHLTRIVPVMSKLSEDRRICFALQGKSPQELQETACKCIICDLMGTINPLNRSNTIDDGRAARWIINDTIIKVDSHIRDGVGIDRVTGTASRQAQAKFDVETLPPGTDITIGMEVEDFGQELDDYLINLALYEWQEKRIRFGGNANRGLGVMEITNVYINDYDLSDTLGLMHYLRHAEHWQASNYCIQPPSREYHADYKPVIAIVESGENQYQEQRCVQSWVEITFLLQAQGFFLTNDMTQATGSGFDHYSLAYPSKSEPQERTPYIPGSSLRGAIRSHAEKIARTIANFGSAGEEEFLRKCTASDPLVTHRTKHPIGLEATVSRIERSQQLDDDMKRNPPLALFDLSERFFGTTYHGSRLSVDDSQMTGEPIWKKLDFVAIDRFTGGAADKMKFDAYALWKPTFECRLYLEFPAKWEIGWLLQVLLDMQVGLVPVGFGGSKGFGDVRPTDINFKFGYAYPEAIEGLGLTKKNIAFFDTHILTVKDLLTQNVIQAWVDEVNRFEVDDRIHHDAGSDPYWGQPCIPILYPAEVNL